MINSVFYVLLSYAAVANADVSINEVNQFLGLSPAPAALNLITDDEFLRDDPQDAFKPTKWTMTEDQKFIIKTTKHEEFVCTEDSSYLGVTPDGYGFTTITVAEKSGDEYTHRGIFNPLKVSSSMRNNKFGDQTAIVADRFIVTTSDGIFTQKENNAAIVIFDLDDPLHIANVNDHFSQLFDATQKLADGQHMFFFHSTDETNSTLKINEVGQDFFIANNRKFALDTQTNLFEPLPEEYTRDNMNVSIHTTAVRNDAITGFNKKFYAQAHRKPFMNGRYAFNIGYDLNLIVTDMTTMEQREVVFDNGVCSVYSTTNYLFVSVAFYSNVHLTNRQPDIFPRIYRFDAATFNFNAIGLSSFLENYATDVTFDLLQFKYAYEVSANYSIDFQYDGGESYVECEMVIDHDETTNATIIYSELGQYIKTSYLESLIGYTPEHGERFPKDMFQFTQAPTQSPTSAPTDVPTDAPTSAPTDVPTNAPTDVPTDVPTDAPTPLTTSSPTNAPTDAPTDAPTPLTTSSPTTTPTDAPTTNSPTNAPTNSPTDAPTNSPTDAPTNSPTDAPTNSPTDAPTTGARRLVDAGNYSPTYMGAYMVYNGAMYEIETSFFPDPENETLVIYAPYYAKPFLLTTENANDPPTLVSSGGGSIFVQQASNNYKEPLQAFTIDEPDNNVLSHLAPDIFEDVGNTTLCPPIKRLLSESTFRDYCLPDEVYEPSGLRSSYWQATTACGQNRCAGCIFEGFVKCRPEERPKRITTNGLPVRRISHDKAIIESQNGAWLLSI